jgi:uncharacterized protein YaiI (UPF0178 family)
MLRILVDSDGCPVKEEVYRVAGRHGLTVTLVANSWMRTPEAEWIRLEVVKGGFNVADDWIAEHATPGDVVVTADIPLAARCLEKGARVVSPRGRVFTPDTIGGALASRALSSHLRECGEMTGGPAPHADRDRSRFLQSLEQVIQAVLRETPNP